MAWDQKNHDFYVVNIENCEWQWCYSAKELQKTLSNACQNQKLSRLMVELYGFLNATKPARSFLDCSYMGGNILLCFEKAVIELDIRVDGVMAYRIFDPWNMKLHPVNGRIPDDYLKRSVYYSDLKNCFELEYVNRTVREVEVDNIYGRGFDAPGFDSEKASAAAEKRDLPGAVHFILDNDVAVRFYADDIEYYRIQLIQVVPMDDATFAEFMKRRTITEEQIVALAKLLILMNVPKQDRLEILEGIETPDALLLFLDKLSVKNFTMTPPEIFDVFMETMFEVTKREMGEQ